MPECRICLEPATTDRDSIPLCASCREGWDEMKAAGDLDDLLRQLPTDRKEN
jgi:hypothetical protein